jgi:PAS domain S-box-containing protein
MANFLENLSFLKDEIDRTSAEMNGIDQDKNSTISAENCEESLKSFIRNVFHHSTDGIVYLSTTGVILDANQQAITMSGSERKNVIGHHFYRLGIIKTQLLPDVIQLFINFLKGETNNFQLSLFPDKDREIRVEASASIVRMPNCPPRIVTVLRDITKKWIVEQQITAKPVESIVSDREKILSICSFCKDIRNEAEEWQALEQYFWQQYNLNFSHGICPTCREEQYPEFSILQTEEKKTEK